MNDILLIHKIKKGDIKAFEKIFKQYYSPLCLYATSLTGRMDAAEEIVQELFYTIWKEKEHMQLLHSLKNYLYTAVRNQSFQYLSHLSVRERYRESVIATDDQKTVSPQEQLEYQELQELVDRTLQRLPERRQQIFRMHRLDGMKYTEIASALSLSVKTIEIEISKTLKELKKEIINYR